MVPRSLGVSSPEGRDVYEFFLTVESRPSILGKISDIFGKNNVDIIGIHGQVSDDKKTGFIIVYVEMSNSTVSAQELSKILKDQEYTVDVVYEERNTYFFEGFLFPLTSGGHYRVFTVGSKEWAALVKSLHNTFGSASTALVYEEGVIVGKAMIGRISSRFSSYPGESVIMKNFMLLYRAAGFGILTVRTDEERLRVRIDYPVIGKEEQVFDFFTIGIVSGAISKVYDTAYRVKDIRFNEDAIEFVLEKEHGELSTSE